MEEKRGLMDLYRLLSDHFGLQHWWPAETRLEMMVGAILTQAVSWENASQAVNRLKEEQLLNLSSLFSISSASLSQLIKASGYYNQKTKKIKALMEFIHYSYGGDLDDLFAEPLESLRAELLGVYGLGPETVDSILLYAGEYPIFVIDRYTYRILRRLGLLPESMDKYDYHRLQHLFMSRLPLRVDLFQEYHALLVAQGKNYCQQRPGCDSCPLLAEEWCQYRV